MTSDTWGSMMAHLPLLRRFDGSRVRALVVDDEPALSEVMSSVLRLSGWDVTVAADGLSAVQLAQRFRPDVLVLDVMLPGLDGVEVLRKIRDHDPNIAALFLTAKGRVEDRITGLTAGGDDYVTKPFSLEEVVLRLHRLVQRSGITAADNVRLVVGDLSMNLDTREVNRAGQDIQLTATQFNLLRFLMENSRHVLSKSQIMDHVWDHGFDGQLNVVELNISYLRKKIDMGREPMIHTVRGAGYVLKPAKESHGDSGG
ncbi:response regulator [Arthrobacter sp. JZ12]|uniref:response regulator transcription factor n=1 Tax=Arthrobacter sp. JZ12 TaxID=2654190 RepID=UPI002B489CF9|nr:response regulator transcription factor [Arthrobacter sp. JZ12]WRH25974.1 response regulator [Arthrobacter sp. JZ12]